MVVGAVALTARLLDLAAVAAEHGHTGVLAHGQSPEGEARDGDDQQQELETSKQR
ncbi:MAG: hypothetical protein AMXMBFR64_55010 [Myxococcales bacterium]